MSPSPDDTGLQLGANLPVYSVSEISNALKRTVEDAFPQVRIRGEVSGLTRAASGHMYLSLKDENAVMDGVCWRGTVQRLGISPEDGLEVIVTGRLSIYPGRSRYQVVIEAMEVAGEGALLKLLEDRRKKLLAEGLFDEDRKQALPYIPEIIGVVTSPTGAVIRDILHRLADRFPRHVLLWPVKVQGDGAAEEIAAAIAGFNRIAEGGPVPRPDLLIVARGGGSLEDLWAFNEEVVVRAAAASEIPLISAVGHETDTTLIDFASDLRAPTPTAAAELAVPVRSELMAELADAGTRLLRGVGRGIEHRKTALDGLARGIADPRRLLDDKMQRLDEFTARLVKAPRAGMERRDERFAQVIQRWRRELPRLLGDRRKALAEAARMLESLSYTRVLERGFAVVRDAADAPLTSAAAVGAGDSLSIEFSDGRVAATAGEGAKAKPKPKPKTKPATPKGDPGDDQGSLL